MTMASGGYVTTQEDISDNDTAVDLTADALMNELVADAHTPNFSTHTSETDITNEVTGTGIAAGGQQLDTVTTTVSSGSLVVDWADESWTTATGTGTSTGRYGANTGSQRLSRSPCVAAQ